MPKRLQADVDFLKAVYPIEKGISYGNGNYEFKRTGPRGLGARQSFRREKISEMSKKSLIRLMFTMQCTQVEFSSMLTLTYPNIYPKDGQLVKKDINAVAQKLRRLEWSYVWFLEFQKRGAPHIHFLVTQDVITPYIRAEFGLFWTDRIAKQEWFQERIKTEDEYMSTVLKMAKFNCHEKTFQPLREKDGAKRYATAYAAKEKQKDVPKLYKNVGRFWGASRDVRPEGLGFDVTEEEVEQWLTENGHPASAYNLVPRFIWALGKLKRKDHETTKTPDGDMRTKLQFDNG